MGNNKSLKDDNKKNDRLEEAFTLWHEFKDSIIKNNRFENRNKLDQLLKKIANRYVTTLKSGTIMYRARKFKGEQGTYDEYEKLLDEMEKKRKSSSDDKDTSIDMLLGYSRINHYRDTLNSNFFGYDCVGSYVPTNRLLVRGGRANPDGIITLYTADKEYTALSEIRPALGEKVSLAKIEISADLKIVDFTYSAYKGKKLLCDFLWLLIAGDLFKIVNDDNFLYIPTQYISEVLKSFGIDGIKYHSSLYGNGINYSIFNYEKASAKSSREYKINDLCYEAEKTGLCPPYDEMYKSMIIHPRLTNLPYIMSKNIKCEIKDCRYHTDDNRCNLNEITICNKSVASEKEKDAYCNNYETKK